MSIIMRKMQNVNILIQCSKRLPNVTRNFSAYTKNNLLKLNTCSCSNSVDNRRWYSEENPKPTSNKVSSLLLDYPIVVWPSIFKTVKNFILFNFIIKPYLDKDFNLPDFIGASKKAVEVVSRKVAEGDIKSLEGLVTNDLIQSLQKAVSLLSLTQREELAINVDDIYFSFPYQVGIIFNEEDGKEQKRFVEITMVYHTLKGLSNMRSKGEEPPINLGMLPEYQQRISICNYRFIREFTNGVEDEWTINLMNHFRPAAELTA